MDMRSRFPGIRKTTLNLRRQFDALLAYGKHEPSLSTWDDEPAFNSFWNHGEDEIVRQGFSRNKSAEDVAQHLGTRTAIDVACHFYLELHRNGTSHRWFNQLSGLSSHYDQDWTAIDDTGLFALRAQVSASPVHRRQQFYELCLQNIDLFPGRTLGEIVKRGDPNEWLGSPDSRDETLPWSAAEDAVLEDRENICLPTATLVRLLPNRSIAEVLKRIPELHQVKWTALEDLALYHACVRGMEMSAISIFFDAEISDDMISNCKALMRTRFTNKDLSIPLQQTEYQNFSDSFSVFQSLCSDMANASLELQNMLILTEHQTSGSHKKWNMMEDATLIHASMMFHDSTEVQKLFPRRNATRRIIDKLALCLELQPRETPEHQNRPPVQLPWKYVQERILANELRKGTEYSAIGRILRKHPDNCRSKWKRTCAPQKENPWCVGSNILILKGS